MPDKGRVVIRERMTLKKWDHDCPSQHGGTCEPEIVVLEWADGVPVTPDNRHWEVKNAAPDISS